jgi:hypothetical protein
MNFGLGEVWSSQGTKCKNKVMTILKNQLHQSYDSGWWQYLCRDDSKLRTYKLFKDGIYMENYLLLIKNPNVRQEFAKLRISAHQLRVELGRYTVPRKTPFENRICEICNREVEDEKHFVMSCQLYKDDRQILFDQLCTFTTFVTLSSDEKFAFIMSYNNGDSEVLRHVIDFINKSVTKRKTYVESKSKPLTK